MVELILQRISEHDNVIKPKFSRKESSTLGILELRDESGVIWSGFSCENGGPSTDESKKDLRIMPGEYSLEWCASSKNGLLAKRYPEWKNKDGSNVAIWVKRKTDKKFNDRLIRIHTGNYPHDTEGCILPGKTGANGIVGDSVTATNELFVLLKKYGLKNVKLIIKEI